jgi:hypothetical protein
VGRHRGRCWRRGSPGDRRRRCGAPKGSGAPRPPTPPAGPRWRRARRGRSPPPPRGRRDERGAGYLSLQEHGERRRRHLRRLRPMIGDRLRGFPQTLQEQGLQVLGNLRARGAVHRVPLEIGITEVHEPVVRHLGEHGPHLRRGEGSIARGGRTQGPRHPGHLHLEGLDVDVELPGHGAGQQQLVLLGGALQGLPVDVDELPGHRGQRGQADQGEHPRQDQGDPPPALERRHLARCLGSGARHLGHLGVRRGI